MVQANKNQFRDKSAGGRRSYLAPALSLLGGAGIGAGLMYLLDPQAGTARRQHLSQCAADSAHGAGRALGETWHGLGQTAHRAGEAFRSTGQQAAEQSREWGATLRSYMPSFARKPQPRGDLLTDALLVAGALAAGAGLMLLLDPQQGRRRRALIRDKVVRGINETRDLARDGGRYVADHARGFFAETRSHLTNEPVSDEQLVARVRSELERVASHVGDIAVTASNGHITLGGNIPALEREQLLSAVRGVQGVREVECFV